jgi:2-polyprenyl-3-methyl-5-hydroxy-6-metoxy-1,4-benzoquinol methylase
LSGHSDTDFETVRCNLCGADHTTTLCRHARWDQQMTNVVCRQCGLVYANPRLRRAPLDRFYREWVYPEFVDASGRFTNRLLDSSRLQAAETFLYFTRRAGESIQGRRLLEVGCGLGDFLALARTGGADVLGVEMEGLYAAHAERAGLPIVRDHVEAISFDAAYDIVAMFHVLEHLEDPKATLISLRPHISAGGRLFLEVPNILGPWKMTLAEFFRVEHLFNFSIETLGALLAAAGYRIVASDADPYVLRVSATPLGAGERAAVPNLAGHYDQVMRHVFRWRVRSRIFQPYYALRRFRSPDARRR